MTFSDAALSAALYETYRLVELGLPPNGTQPVDCGPYGEAIAELRETYVSTFQATDVLVQTGHSNDDPHTIAVQRVRDVWATLVRANLPHEQPLIEAMRMAATGGSRPRLGFLSILQALQAAPDEEEARQRLALDLVDDASLLKPDELLRLKGTLKSLGLPTGWVREWSKAVAAAIKTRRQNAALIIPAPVDQDAPEEHKATWPYLVIAERMVFCAQKADMFGGASVAHVPIADFHAAIVEEQCGEDGRKVFLVEGATVTHRPFQLTIEAEDFADDRKLKAVLTAGAGAAAPIYVGMAKHLAPAIQRLSGDIPSVRRYTRTGWANGTFLLPGRTIEGVTIQLGRKLPYSVSDDAQLEIGLQALEALLRSHTPECGGPALAFLLTPPLALPAGWRNERYGTFITGRTGSLKSSWAQAAMCLYGPGFIRDDLLVRWGQGATANAMMGLAISAYDLPVLIDNYKPNTGGGEKDFINLIHAIVEGGEKDRLNRSSELRDSRPIFAWPLVTGEDVPNRDPSSLARVLVLNFTRPAGDPSDLSTAQRLSAHLCAVGLSWITWIEGDEGQAALREIAARFDQTRREWATALQQHRPDMVNVLRVASNLATNELTWAVAETHPAIGPVLRRYGAAYEAGLNELARHMASYTAESLEAARFVGYLQDLLTTEQAVLIKRGSNPGLDSERMIGWRDDDKSVYLLPGIARAMVERHFGRDCLNGISERTLYTQMAERGYIIPGQEKTTVLFKEAGRVHRVLRVHPTALGSDTDAG